MDGFLHMLFCKVLAARSMQPYTVLFIGFQLHSLGLPSLLFQESHQSRSMHCLESPFSKHSSAFF